jgi:hypothetical protein
MRLALGRKSRFWRGLEPNVEILGVELAAVQQSLSMAATLLSVGLLVALAVIGWAQASQQAATVILEPAPTPEQLPAASGGRSRRPRACLATRAPPVLLWQRIAMVLDRPAVE